MLTHRSCVACGRRVRLSITIQPPRCPACRLARFPALLGTRPCLRCRVPIPTDSSDLSRRSTALRMPVEFAPQPTMFNPFVNSFQQPDLPRRNRPRLLSSPPSRTHSTQWNNISFVVDQRVGFLRQEHESRVVASHVFPPKISPFDIRLSVSRFENGMKLASGDTIYCSYGKLVPSTDIRRFLDGDPLLLALERFLDSYGYNDGF
ncbi:hypothetical protein N7467_001568 [Penicillium canescens]|nr:hypothetical protein N7467_001568 [Penicillium canescens]